MEKSYPLFVNSQTERTYDTNEMIGEFAHGLGLSKAETARVTLLVEETVGMVRAMGGMFEGELWLEGEPGCVRILLEAGMAPDPAAEERKPAEPEGFMAKIAEMLSCAYRFESADDVPGALRNAVPVSLQGGLDDADGETPVLAGNWTLSAYRASLQKLHRQDALAELEKSIVASLADDVTVGVSGSTIRLVITRRTGD